MSPKATVDRTVLRRGRSAGAPSLKESTTGPSAEQRGLDHAGPASLPTAPTPAQAHNSPTSTLRPSMPPPELPRSLSHFQPPMEFVFDWSSEVSSAQQSAPSRTLSSSALANSASAAMPAVGTPLKQSHSASSSKHELVQRFPESPSYGFSPPPPYQTESPHSNSLWGKAASSTASHAALAQSQQSSPSLSSYSTHHPWLPLTSNPSQAAELQHIYAQRDAASREFEAVQRALENLSQAASGRNVAYTKHHEHVSWLVQKLETEVRETQRAEQEAARRLGDLDLALEQAGKERDQLLG